jgi:hypothetical protein
VREKRRYIYAEDAEEIFVDRVLSGEDAYMGGWTNQTIIPGISIEADVMFSAMVSSEIVNDYNIFICQCIQSLEESGIDCELTLNFQSNESLGGKYRGRHDLPVHNVVRVKRENEASDFGSFSPMISPAALRTFGFAAIMIHNEIRRVKAPAGLGRGHRGRSWDVKYDDTSGKILFQCEYSPRSFPISTMQTKFQNAIAEISG